MLDRCHSISDLRECARRRLPDQLFQFLDGGAESELTAQRNTLAFDDVKLLPRCLVDVAQVNTSTRILGQAVHWPVLCSPTGASRLFHPDGELAVARAAQRAGTLFSLAIGSTYSLDAVAAANSGPKMFQVYLYTDRDITRELIRRSKQAGYAALCLTVDVPAMGKRERDLRSGFGMPPKWTPRTVLDYAMSPRWVFGQVRKGPLGLAHFLDANGKPERGRSRQLDSSASWKDVREIVDLWGGPIAIKGVMSAQDAVLAADAGATAVIVSNHGGRQFDGGAATIEALPQIVQAVGDRVEVILDGGVRRGMHVLKALSYGAKACSIGRPYLYGLAAGGERGVAKALSILQSELRLAMQLAGCPDIASIRAASLALPRLAC
jgi:L-lactate dehydrogenase (cytochrome)